MTETSEKLSPPIRSEWTDRLKQGAPPRPEDVREHLRTVHRTHAGFAEACAMRCKDETGRNSYEWLLEVVDPSFEGALLDLGCGGGALIAFCHERLGHKASYFGVDMSADELALARVRLPDSVSLHQGLAQNMSFIEDESVDAVLCHWALTLMSPIEPALHEVRRILKPGGLFAAVVDGDLDAAPGYGDVHRHIYGWVSREYPSYGAHELGDPRVRRAEDLTVLVESAFDGAHATVDPGVFSMGAEPSTLAREAADFFYASYVLSPPNRRTMLAELEAMFASPEHQRRFSMPINRLAIRKMNRRRD